MNNLYITSYAQQLKKSPHINKPILRHKLLIESKKKNK